MRRDNFRRVKVEYSNLETQPASEIGVGLAQRPCAPQRIPPSTSVLKMERGKNGP